MVLAIVMLPDSTVATNGECYDEVYDQAYRRDVPSNVLPDGLPFGLNTHRSLYVCIIIIINYIYQPTPTLSLGYNPIYPILV